MVPLARIPKRQRFYEAAAKVVQRRMVPNFKKSFERANLQNQAIGWLPKGCRSLGGGTVVRFPRIWSSSGECRFKARSSATQAFLA